MHFQNYLYGKGTKAITFNDFINRELILYSNMDNTRSIPSMVDGLKPGQRKVLFTCLKRNLTKELKVAQLAGSVAEMSAYHHGEVSKENAMVYTCILFVKFFFDILELWLTIDSYWIGVLISINKFNFKKYMFNIYRPYRYLCKLNSSTYYTM